MRLRPRYPKRPLPCKGRTVEVGPGQLGPDLWQLIARGLRGSSALSRLAASCRGGCHAANGLPPGSAVPMGPAFEADGTGCWIRTAVCPLGVEEGGPVRRTQVRVTSLALRDLGRGELRQGRARLLAAYVDWPLSAVWDGDDHVLPTVTHLRLVHEWLFPPYAELFPALESLVIGSLPGDARGMSCDWWHPWVARLCSYRRLRRIRFSRRASLDPLARRRLLARLPGVRQVEGGRRCDVPPGVEWIRR